MYSTDLTDIPHDFDFVDEAQDNALRTQEVVQSLVHQLHDEAWRGSPVAQVECDHLNNVRVGHGILNLHLSPCSEKDDKESMVGGLFTRSQPTVVRLKRHPSVFCLPGMWVFHKGHPSVRFLTIGMRFRKQRQRKNVETDIDVEKQTEAGSSMMTGGSAVSKWPTAARLGGVRLARSPRRIESNVTRTREVFIYCEVVGCAVVPNSTASIRSYLYRTRFDPPCRLYCLLQSCRYL